MEYKTDFNWVLKLRQEQGFPESLQAGKVFDFEKKEERIYPVDNPIKLVNEHWESVGKVLVKEFTVSKNQTTGRTGIIKVYEKKVNIL